MATQPLIHQGTKKDEERAAEAKAHLDSHKDLQFHRGQLTMQRDLELPWWTPEQLHHDFPAAVRMKALEQRPDLRLAVFGKLFKGLPENTVYNMPPELQAQLLESTLTNKDKTYEEFEAAFPPEVMVMYMDARLFWWRFRDMMPMDDSNPKHQELLAFMIESVLELNILTHLDIEWSIDGDVWETHMSKAIRVKVRQARLELQKQKPTKPFLAKDEMAIATPDEMVKNIPVKHFVGVLDAIEKALSLEKPAPPKEEPKPALSTVEGPVEPVVDDKALTVPPPAPAPAKAPPPSPALMPPCPAPPAPASQTEDESEDVGRDTKPPDSNDKIEINVDDEPQKPRDSKPGEKSLPKFVATLSNSDFEAAGGVKADTPKPSGSDLSVSDELAVEQYLIDLMDLGLQFPDKIAREDAEVLKTLFLDHKWPEEAQLRQAVLLAMPVMDPIGHPTGGAWKDKLISANVIKFELKKLLSSKPAWKKLLDALYPMPKPPMKQK